MSNVIAEQIVEDLTLEKVALGHMFTAFDISMFAKKEKGMTERHRNVKHVVHELFVGGQMAGYDRTLIDIPGAPEKAFLYHPAGEDISKYNPKDRSTFPTPCGITVTPSTPTLPAATTSAPKPGFKVDRRGRLCVRNSLTKKLGWDYNTLIFATAEQGGLLLSSKATVGIVPLTNYWLDKDDNIRISAKTLRKAGIPTLDSKEDRYDIQISGQDVLVTKI